MKHLLARLFLTYLRFFAKKALEQHNPTIIGIAGSVGKSGTAHALFSVLKLHGSTKLVGNSETGIPLGILGIQPKDYTIADWLRMLVAAPQGIDHLQGTKYLIAEMGIDEPFPPKNMGYLLTILKPTIAVVLNESATHSQQFEKALSDEERTKSDEEKLKLLVKKIAEEDCRIITESDCKVAIYNADDENIRNVILNPDSIGGTKAKDQDSSAKPQNDKKPLLLPFGQEKSNAVSYKTYEVSTSSSSFSFSSTIKQYSNIAINIKFPGILLPREYEQTFAAVTAIAGSLEVPILTLIKGLESFSLPAGRSSLLTGSNNSKIIDSSYNASKAAMFAFLEMMHTLKKNTKRPIVFLFGDMRELGNEAKIEHEAVAQKLIGIVDYLYLVGPLTQKYVLPTYNLELGTYNLKEVRWFLNSKYAGEYLKDHIPPNALILVKGSQNTIFLEEAIKYILAEKDDAKRLCRQSNFWLDVKRKQNIL